MANIFDTLLQSKRPQALETISKAKKEREAFVKKLQETVANSLTEVIELIYSELPSNTETVKICINKWVAIAKVSKDTVNNSETGFGIHYSVFVDSMADYHSEGYKCLIPFNVFDSEAIYFGDTAECQKAMSEYAKVKEENKCWYNYDAGVNPLYFYLFYHKEFQFISLEEIFGGEFITEFVVDLTKDDENKKQYEDEDDENKQETK